MWFNHIDAQFHQACVHLGKSYLFFTKKESISLLTEAYDNNLFLMHTYTSGLPVAMQLSFQTFKIQFKSSLNLLLKDMNKNPVH